MTAANCKTTLGLLADLLEGALSAADEASLRAHLATCPKCTEFMESYRATTKIVREATDIELPGELEQRLLAFIDERSKGGSKPS